MSQVYLELLDVVQLLNRVKRFLFGQSHYKLKSLLELSLRVSSFQKRSYLAFDYSTPFIYECNLIALGKAPCFLFAFVRCETYSHFNFYIIGCIKILTDKCWKQNNGPQTRNIPFTDSNPRKRKMPKIALISHTRNVMLRVLQYQRILNLKTW